MLLQESIAREEPLTVGLSTEFAGKLTAGLPQQQALSTSTASPIIHP